MFAFNSASNCLENASSISIYAWPFKVLDLESKVIDLKSSFTHRIAKLENRVDQLEKANKALKEKSFKTTQVDTAAPVENMEKSFKQGRMTANMDEDVEEAQARVVEAAKLMTEVVTTAQPTTTAAQVPKPSTPRRKRGVIIQDPEETATLVIVHSRVQVHVITFTTTQMILLVEKKYPLTHFTLQQMLDNVRLEVEEESEISLEMLRPSTEQPASVEGNSRPQS
nr:hypothetical protein [Tanacetum cinerariifolium]